VTALLALLTVVTWGAWIPLAQVMPGVPQRVRTFFATLGNVVLASAALVVSGGSVSFGWRAFWLPLVGGLVWTGGNYSAFRASELIGLARAAGSWTPLNVIVSFVWGILLFGELDHQSTARLAVLSAALVVVIVGVLFIVRSQDTGTASSSTTTGFARAPHAYRTGLLWAVGAGVLWGSYFVPAQWAKVSATAGNFPLTIGILVAGAVLVLPCRRELRLPPKVTAVQVAAGALFGVGNIALLGLVKRVGTGAGFTIAQLSLIVNASIGIWVFKVPKPGSRAARAALVGIVLAGAGGSVIGAVR
jgi:glucose uptake protein